MIWHGCYDGNWNCLITPESFAHPAKFARRLAEKKGGPRINFEEVLFLRKSP